MLILPKDLQNQKKVKKEKKALTIKNAVIRFNEEKKFLILLKVEYFRKQNKE